MLEWADTLVCPLQERRKGRGEPVCSPKLWGLALAFLKGIGLKNKRQLEEEKERRRERVLPEERKTRAVRVRTRT